MSRTIVRVRPVADGGLTGYEAVQVVPAYDWELGWREPWDDTVIAVGPYSDALLPARTAAIDWAEQLGVPFEESRWP